MRRKIEKDKIWETIWYGGDFMVKMYGTEEVIKFSTLSFILWKKHKEKMINDYNICKKYFEDFVVNTEAITKKRKYIEVQKYIKWEKLQEQHFKDKKVKIQFRQIIKIMGQMEKQWIENIDLVWIDGILKNYFWNIIVDENKKLHIIDASLLECKSIWMLYYTFGPFMYIAKILQKRMIQNYSIYLK